MEYNKDKVDEMALALIYLTTFNNGYGNSTWKGYDWTIMDRLHEKGYICDPKSKAKSVVLLDEGAKLSEKLFKKHFQ